MKCIDEGSYNAVFIIGVVLALMFLIVSAYVYNATRKARKDNKDDQALTNAQGISMASIVVATAGIVTLFTVYFGYRKSYDITGVSHGAQMSPSSLHRGSVHGMPFASDLM